MTNSTGKPNRSNAKAKIVGRRKAPGKTIESRENQLISMAVELAAKQIMDGTASSQVITHFLKLGSTQALLEKAKLERETALLQAKADALQSQKRVEELYSSAMKAFRTYSGQEQEGYDED